MSVYLRNYIEQLKAQTETSRHTSTAREDRHQCPRSKPLTEQIEALMRSLPPAQRDRPWTVAELVTRLDGQYKDRPSAGNVGQALRALGWTRVRDWSASGGGRRIWLLNNERV